MLKRLLLMLLLASAALAATVHAQPVPRHFSFTGFFHEETAQFVPTANVSGYFESEDSNRNGVHERSEVTWFLLNGQQILPNCGDAFICSLSTFTYTPGGALNFDTSWGSDPLGESFAGGQVRTGDRAATWFYTPTRSGSSTYRWTDQTTLSISPVPEPATYMLLVAGLAMLAFHARRRYGRLKAAALSTRYAS